MIMMKNRGIIVLALLSIVLLAGCAGGGGAAPEAVEEPEVASFTDDVSGIEPGVACELFLSSNIKALIPSQGSVFIPNTGNELVWSESSADPNIIIVEITNKASSSISRKFAMIGGTVTDQPQLGGWQVNFPPETSIAIAPTGALTISLSSGDCDLTD